jgi:glycosyltransferase involved in cell wall biosynthesis
VRVLFLTTSYPTGETDSRGIHIHRLASSLVVAGVEVSVIVPAGRSRHTDYTLNGVAVHPVNYWIPRYQTLAEGLGGIMPNLKQRPALILQVPLMLLAMLLACRRRTGDVDLIHAHWMIPAGLIAAISKRGRPVVVTSHGGDVDLASRSKLMRMVAGWVIDRVDLCLGVSEAIVQSLAELRPGSAICRFQPLGVDGPDRQTSAPCEAAATWGLGEGELHVVFVGSLIDRKQPGLLVDAVADLRSHDISVVAAFVGDGPLRRELETAVSSAGLDVTFAGDTPPVQVAAWLRNADVLVLPSLSEGRPVVIMEAMAAALPVVATDIPGVRELVEDSKTGFLIPPGSSGALASALRMLDDDRDLAAELGLAGRNKLVAECLLADQVAASHIALYSAAVTRP